MDNWTTSHERVLAQRRSEGWMFLIEAARDMRTIGAVAPSGTSLARALIRSVQRQGPGPLDILEAGAGTGAVTRTLLAHQAPGTRLDVVEANPRFAERLRLMARIHPGAAGRPDRVRVHHGRIEDFDGGRRYDAIVSALPLTNFTAEQSETIMNRYVELLRPGGMLSYFGYLGTRRARELLSPRTETDRHRAVEEVLAAYRRRFGVGCSTVWANFPPARVWYLQRPRASSPEAAAGPSPVVR